MLVLKPTYMTVQVTVMNNNRTYNNNNINEIPKADKINDHHLGEKDQIKTKKLVVNEKKESFRSGRQYGLVHTRLGHNQVTRK